MELLFVRHGETDWNARGWIQGQTDTPLNDIGRAQADELACALKRERIKPCGLYTSPQRRAMETARILGMALGLKPVPMEGRPSRPDGRRNLPAINRIDFIPRLLTESPMPSC